MKRKPIEVSEYAPLILSQLPKGILLNTAADGVEDTMIIGWGSLGTNWGLPVFTAYVRESRYTRELLDQNGEFTVSIPLAGSDIKQIVAVCGTKSGRDCDKFKECDLTVVPGESVSTPAIAQLPVTLECKVICRQPEDPKAILPELIDRYYANGDFHIAYSGQIVNAYLLEEE